jgi:hypothetical protein
MFTLEEADLLRRMLRVSLWLLVAAAVAVTLFTVARRRAHNRAVNQGSAVRHSAVRTEQSALLSGRSSS